MMYGEETGSWLVLAARGTEPDCLAHRTLSREEAEDVAAELRDDGEDARVVPERYDGPEA